MLRAINGNAAGKLSAHAGQSLVFEAKVRPHKIYSLISTWMLVLALIRLHNTPGEQNPAEGGPGGFQLAQAGF